MRFLALGRFNLIGLATVAAVLGACGAAQSPVAPVQSGSTQSLPQWQVMRSAHPACAKPGPGEVQCYALIINTGAEPNVAPWKPKDFQARYKLPSSTKGSGEIVAVVDAFDNPNVASDVGIYRGKFGLGTANFRKYNQDGKQSNYPAGNHGWGVEIDLDVQMVSAACPLCTIYLVEAKSARSRDLETAEAQAVALGAHIVSNSWGCAGSGCIEQSYFDSPGVQYLASSGDSGSGQLSAPAVLDSVAAIGGTMLSKSGSHYSESLWSGTGGGCATTVPKPKWQKDKVCSGRAVGDASAVAWGVAVYDSYGYDGWGSLGGTSVSAPLLAGVFGLAGNAAQQGGGRTFWQNRHHKDLYDLCGSSCLFKTYSYEGGWGSPNGIGAF